MTYGDNCVEHDLPYDTCRFCLQNEINALTAENNLLRSQRDAWKEIAEYQYGQLRLERGDKEDYPVLGALDAWAGNRFKFLR